MIFQGKKILFIGAHPDDIELGCGALISHIINQSEIICITLSDNQGNTLLNNLDNLIEEHYSSMAVLGVPRKNILMAEFNALSFHDSRQKILEYLNEVKRTYKPDVVFVHSQADLHQDHNILTKEVLRAFRDTTLLGFEVLRSSYGFVPNFFFEVTGKDVDCKIKALAKYNTYASKYYFDPNIIRSKLILQGGLVACPFAEGFDIFRIICDLH
jgi:LmbE family N-acetylglucosaminyl deacetylase